MRGRLLALLLAMVSWSVSAETLLLIPGYLSGGSDWRLSGISTTLITAGWQDGGHLNPSLNSPLVVGPKSRSSKRFYTVALPTEAPVMVQSRELARYVDFVSQKHPGESLYLVGHSAGGIVARYYMVTHPKQRVAALITIATPHGGTDLAEAGLFAGQTPLAWMAPLMGADEINRSQGLYYDLLPEQPGNLLFWLNRQHHPQAEYVSIVRSDSGLFGDMVVRPESQDMNFALALRGRSRVIPTASGHSLSFSDGPILREVLRRLQSP